MEHKRHGFTSKPIALKHFSVGSQARELENTLKRLMRAHQIPNCTEAGLKFDGSTEAFRITDATAFFKSKFEWCVGW